MTYLNPYLGFHGRCREAMTFYQECLGGELNIMTVGESPMCNDMPDGKESILHAALTNGRIVLMGTDMAREAPVQGNTMALSLNCSSEDETRDAFAKLSAGGQVICPLEPAFWGALFGVLNDKFGMTWMLNCDNNITKE
jgi:PhnB protein